MTALQTVIDKNASLSNDSRAAGDYDNDTAEDHLAIPYLTVHYDTTAPAAGDLVAELWVLPGDGETTEVFPEGGDGTVGSNVDAQSVFYAGAFESRDPSTSTDEVLALPPHKMYPYGNRYVIKNISGQTFNSTWQLDIKPFKEQDAGVS